ncbi:DUF551 domain-containing protein [Frateuria terrea]|uniref:DUF551 domain-containing protein n=1 Tax=Frateuria terrea TaxID=529704 RepID=A0A1H6ZR23_9GAMM|nr:DUF551 domain-containing protein [Frateuria terrea]SEJ54614.1 Protein of unknown function [Frateuria terrea]SFP47827.1 Protein of unknown function [Frateuria terrea]
MGWQPIETLDPKCGMFLAFHPHLGQRILTVASYDGGWFYNERGDLYPKQAVTHWHPLPDAPQEDTPDAAR